IPAGVALDRHFRPALLSGAWLTALGGAVRFGADTFAFALLGQLLIAVAQPLILNAITKVVATSLPPMDRPRGISLGTAGSFAGTAIGLPLGPALASAESFTPLLAADLVIAVLAAAAMTLALRGRPRDEGPEVAVVREQLRAIWSDRLIRRVCGVAFLGF